MFKEPRTVGGALCLACAKRISSRLDAVIDQVEGEYRRNPPLIFPGFAVPIP
jgi:hypothetical protein